MDNSIHSLLIAQQVKDRIGEATAARDVRTVSRARRRRHIPRLQLRRRLARPAPAEPARLAPLPPR